MSKYHAVSSGMVTRSALPSITRQRGTTTGSANLYGAGKTTVSNNTTFVDSSANNFTVTRNGDTVQSGFNPFSQASAGAGYFDGTGDYLTVAGGLPSGASTAFTMECWININNLSGYNAITRGDSSPRLDWGVTPTGALSLDSVTVSNICASAAGVIQIDTWYHVAVTRSTGNIYKLWVNGTNVATSSAFATSMLANTTIGYSAFSASHYFKGYISNFRVVASEVYTSNFTPPTSPLTAITNTSLLLLMDNYSIVNSTSTNLPVTINGNTTISTAQYPTGMSSSIYFDGTGDYLSFPTFSPFTLGSGAFTFEFFVNSPTVASNTCIIDTRSAAGVAGYFVSINTSQQIVFNYLSNYTSTTALTANTWTHVAIVRVGSTVQMYINGVAESGTFTSSATITANAANIGQKSSTSSSLVNFSGYLSNMRLVQGASLYTSNFTPPSLPMSTTVTVPAFVTNNIYGMNQIP